MQILSQKRLDTVSLCILCETQLKCESLVCSLCQTDCCQSNLEWQDILLRADARHSIQNQYLSKLYSFNTHEYPFANWIAKFKYQGNLLAREALYQHVLSRLALNSELNLVEFDLVVPTPIHWTRFWLRGFNQAEWIARIVAEKLKLEYAPIVKKCKYTHQQMSANANVRRSQLQNSFSLKPTQLKGLNILLVDDVVTTGATLNQIAKLLMKNKASSVSGLSLTWAKLD